MITLQRLEWDNCFSYGEGNSLNLADSSVTQILGTNGVGKSSIPLIIEEALFNKNSKGVKKADIPNRHLNKGYRIKLTFKKDEDIYTVDINRKSSVKVVFSKNGEDISSHTATNTFKSIQDIIGLDFKTFSQLVYQNTNASLQFLTATDTNRKKFLIDLLSLEKYVELFEIFKEKAKDTNTAMAEVRGSVDATEKWLNENKLTDTTILPMLKIEELSETDEQELRSLTTQLENISDRNKKISMNNKKKEMLKKINLEELESIKADQIIEVGQEMQKLGNLSGVIAGAEKHIDKINSLKDKCPTCEQGIDDVFKENLLLVEREALKQASQEFEELGRKIDEIKFNNRQFERKSNIQREWTEIYRSIDQGLGSSLLDAESLEDSIAGVRSRISVAKRAIQESAAENEKRSRHNTKIEVIKEQTEAANKQLEKDEARLNAIEEEHANLEVLKKAFSTNGLIAYKIENLVKELEELVNHYLGELSDGRFTLEFVVSNDKLNVQITDNGNIVDILALSSGELARVNTATLIAIRKLMSSISKSRINVLFLDEVINVLDDTGREKLVEVLLGEDLNTYIVSHQWTHPLLNKIEIVKEDNVSKLM